MKKILNKIKMLKRADKICFTLANIHFIITFFTDKNIFIMNELNITNYIFCKIILYIILILIWSFIAKLIKKEESALMYFKYFLKYIIPMLILLIFLWPGTWYGGDLNDFYIHNTKAEYFYHLHYLTSIFNIISYMLFPATSGPMVLISLFFGITFSYLLTNLSKIYSSKWINLMIIPFILFHTLFYTFYPNRPIIYSLIYLIIISTLIFDYLQEKKLTLKKGIVLCLLTSLVANWRSESIYFFVAVPILIFVVYKIKFNIKNATMVFFSFFLAFYIVSMPQSNGTKNVSFFERNMPMFIGPLSNMLLDENIRISKKEYKDINEVLDVDAMKNYASVLDTPCIWEAECVKGYESNKELKNFLISYVKVIQKNLKLYLSAKYETFLNATTINGDHFTTKDKFLDNEKILFEREDTKTTFGYEVRKAIYTLLEGKTEYNLTYDKIVHISGSLWIPLGLILLIFIYSIIKRKLLYFLISGMLLLHTLLVFITSPAAYFMYYFNVYLCGWFIGILFIINLFVKKKTL